MCFITSAFWRPAHAPCTVSGPLHVTPLPTVDLHLWMVPEEVGISAMICCSLPQAVVVSVPPEHHPLWCDFLRILFVHLSGNTGSLALSFYPKCHSLPFLSTWWHPKYGKVALMTFINIYCWHWLPTCFANVKSVSISPFAGLWCWALFSALFEALRVSGK